MKEEEDKYTRISKKVRNKLIYYTYIDINKKIKVKNFLLINSMTPNELNNKYQKCSDYCVEKIETYTSSQMNNGINNNNYFHVSLTYCSLNNNYHMLVDNKNVEQYIGKNNIVGKYYKGNTIQIGTTTDKIKYNISLNKNKLEKKIIGENKFRKKHRNSSSSETTKNIHIIKQEKNNDINDYEYLDFLRSNNNDENYKKIIKENIEKIGTNCGNKIRKTNTQRILNKYMIKLKKYCSNFIKIEKKISSKKNIKIIEESPSPTNDKKKKNKNDKNNFKSSKDKPKIPKIPSNENINIINENINENNSNLNIINPENKTYRIHKKLKSQTKIHREIFKITTKSSFRKHKSIENIQEESISPKRKSPKKPFSPKKNSPKHKKNSPKKIFSPKNKNFSPKKPFSPKHKNYSPKKIFSPKNKNFSPKNSNFSPKKGNIFDFNSGPGIPTPTSKFFNAYQKEKANDVNNIRKYTSGNNNFHVNKRKTNIVNNNNGGFKLNSKNEKVNSIIFRGNNTSITRKGRFKKSLTINKMFKFRAGEQLEKKINNLKIKDKY